MAQRPRDVTLAVLMEGTANPMDEVTTQIAMFYRIVQATPLAAEEPLQLATKPGHYKLGFNGCGVSHGIKGTIFAVGLREQCKVIRTYVEAFMNAGNTVQVNFVGLSRGGIGGAYLAQELADMDRGQMLLNLLLFDPVPGNFIWISRYLDWCGKSNANQAMDISKVENLGRVVVLYPHEPLPHIAVHAPLLLSFPASCQLEQDVILGCHQGALWLRPKADTCLAFARIRDFLLELGTRLECDQVSALDVPDAHLARLLAEELRRDAPTTRSSHATKGGVEIVRYSSGQYLCRSHEALLHRLHRAASPAAQEAPQYMLDFADP